MSGEGEDGAFFVAAAELVVERDRERGARL
jgi:hypothetical protein